MEKKRERAARVALSLMLIASASSMGCGDDNGGAAAGTFDGPVYAMMTQVYANDDRTVYVSLTNGIDFDRLSLEGAREFGGVANLAAFSGRLLISEGEAPIIREFDITDDLQWIERRSLSFGAYPLGDNANFYAQFFLDDHTVYLPYEQTRRIIWDPSEMMITGTAEDSALALTIVEDERTLDVVEGGNRNGVRYDGPVMQAFFYVDDDWFFHGSWSAIAVYDETTHAEIDIIEAPCPGLSIATRDEHDRTYFSAWGYAPTLALYGIGPEPCVVRVTSDRRLDTDFTTDFTSWTDGRYVNNFRYVGGGFAIANVLHHEALTGADWEGPYDPAIVDLIWESGPHWRLWIFDMENEEAHLVEGIDVDISSGAQFAVLEGRTFVFLPYDDWNRTKVYEIDDEGVATERYDTPGDVFKWIRVR